MSLRFNSLSKNVITFTYANFVSNGNFANGITGWTVSNSTISAAGNILSVVGDGANATARAYQQTSIGNSVNSKIYVSAKIKVTNAVANYLSLFLSDALGVLVNSGLSQQLTPTSDNVYKLSLVATCQAGLNGNYRVYVNHNYADAATANGKVMQVQEVFAIDLTALFGSGNEPSAADCANIFRFVDGTKQPSLSKVLVT